MRIHMKLDDYEEYLLSKSEHMDKKISDNVGCISFLFVIVAFSIIALIVEKFL